MPKEMQDVASRASIREGFAFDPHSDTYPPELDTALIAWRAVSRSPKDGQSPGKQLREWLDKNNPELTPEARDRIVTVCNWRKRGGRPSTK
jgi:hypothetical protein